MTCTCPKCNAEIELNPAEIPAEGSFHKCSACSTNLEIRKESFAKRALYKSNEISCAECGSPPGTSIYCQSCHAIYPELLVVETSSAAKKQLGKIVASFNLLKAIKLGGPSKAHQDSYSHTPSPGKDKGKGVKLPGQPAQLAVILALLFVAAVAGGYIWYQNKIATEYSQQYVRVLLGMKTARDVDVAISNRVAASWKAGASPTLTGAEQKSIALAKKDVDNLMQRIGKVPEKFTASNEALKKLYGSYDKLHAAAKTTAGTSETYASSVRASDEEFKKSAGELKAGLPEKISAILGESRKKYKPLQDF